MRPESTPAGEWVSRPGGHRTFEPAPLPPRHLPLTGPMLRALSTADRHLGRLEGQVAARPTSEALADLACLREAVASSRLDGSSVTLRDLLWWELDGARAKALTGPRGEVRIAANYARSLRDAAESPAPAAGDLLRRTSLCSLHARLFRGIRGRDESPGRLRCTEIWLGPRGSTLHTAHYVPPAPQTLETHLQQLLTFAVDDDLALPPLARAALLLAQLESIHPFVDASGRVTRLVWLDFLRRTHGPGVRLLCPSAYLARDVGTHFDRLQRVRLKGDWAGWIVHVAQVLTSAARSEEERLTRLDDVLQEHDELLQRHEPGMRAPGKVLLDYLARRPIVSVQRVAEVCERTFANANVLVARLEDLGLMEEITGRRRHRRYLWSGLEHLGDI